MWLPGSRVPPASVGTLSCGIGRRRFEQRVDLVLKREHGDQRDPTPLRPPATCQ